LRVWLYKMKKKFSTKWNSSKQPRKQRKFRANAPLHIKKKFLGANLSKELRKKYSRRSFVVRKGDTVKILRGKFRGQKGKIDTVSIKKGVIRIEKIQSQKKDGTKISIPIQPSNVQIQELNLEDKKRIAALKKERGKKIKEDKTKKRAEEKKEKKGTKPDSKTKSKPKQDGAHKKTDNK